MKTVSCEEPGIWNQDVACDFATTEGVTELTENHWKVINYLRNYYLQFGIAPMIRKLCKETGFKLNEIYADVPVRTGQGGLQAGRASQADRLRIEQDGDAMAVQAKRSSRDEWLAATCCGRIRWQTAQFLATERDPFRNPVGTRCPSGAAALLLDELLGDMDRAASLRRSTRSCKSGPSRTSAPSRAVGVPVPAQGHPARQDRAARERYSGRHASTRWRCWRSTFT